jgi:hypothetical protein
VNVATSSAALQRSNYSVNAGVLTVTLYLQSRLRNVCQAFNAFDFPIRNANCLFIMGFNQLTGGTPAWAYRAAGGAVAAGTVVQAQSITNFQGTTCPVIVTDLGSTLGGDVNGGVSNLSNVSCQFANGSNMRLYIPTIKLHPSIEARLGSDPVTVRKYRDFTIATYASVVSPNNGINWNIQNSLPGIKSVAICAFLHSSSSIVSGGYPDYQQMTSPAPGLPGSPMCFLANPNLQVNSKPVLSFTPQYAQQEWEQIVSKNRMNDSNDSAFSTGASGIDSWLRSTPGFIKYDLSRITQSSAAPASLMFTCSSAAPSSNTTFNVWNGAAATSTVSGIGIELVAVIEVEKILTYHHYTGECTSTASN